MLTTYHFLLSTLTTDYLPLTTYPLLLTTDYLPFTPLTTYHLPLTTYYLLRGCTHAHLQLGDSRLDVLEELLVLHVAIRLGPSARVLIFGLGVLAPRVDVVDRLRRGAPARRASAHTHLWLCPPPSAPWRPRGGRRRGRGGRGWGAGGGGEWPGRRHHVDLAQLHQALLGVVRLPDHLLLRILQLYPPFLEAWLGSRLGVGVGVGVGVGLGVGVGVGVGLRARVKG